jgi:hypothetical protein
MPAFVAAGPSGQLAVTETLHGNDAGRILGSGGGERKNDESGGGFPARKSAESGRIVRS